MPRTLRKAQALSRTAGAGTRVAHPELRPVEGGSGAGVDADVMTDPLHPMHRELVARISGLSPQDERLPRAQRLAIVFYAAIAAWGLVWLMVETAITAL